jgi:hypothetical protein
MHHLIALFAGCLLNPPADDPCREAREVQHEFLTSHDARDVEWHANGTVKAMKATGIFLRSGVADLEADDPAPQILDAIGPALLARGTEELRVRLISRGTTAGEIVIKLDEYIEGREVRWAHVNVVVVGHTDEVTQVYAGFMRDRGLDHRPRLSPMEARFKAETTTDATLRAYGTPERRLYFSDIPARLGYEFQKIESSTIFGGALVWIFDAPFRVCVDAATGEIVRLYPPPLHDP